MDVLICRTPTRIPDSYSRPPEGLRNYANGIGSRDRRAIEQVSGDRTCSIPSGPVRTVVLEVTDQVGEGVTVRILYRTQRPFRHKFTRRAFRRCPVPLGPIVAPLTPCAPQLARLKTETLRLILRRVNGLTY